MRRMDERMDRQAAKAVRCLNHILDLGLMVFIVFAFLVSMYAVWDSHVINADASPEQYEVFEPSVDNTLSFDQLKAKNEDVFSWVTIYGTRINYPILQGEDNKRYVNTDAQGKYSLSGSIFLDFRGHRDLHDFNNLLYGHHMAGGMMFGDIDLYLEQGFLDSHQYGKLFLDNREYGLEVFAVLKGDALEENLFAGPLETEAQKSAYLSLMKNHALFYNDIGVTTNDRLLILSTCADGRETDRHLLVAKILEQVPKNPFPVQKKDTRVNRTLLVSTQGEYRQVPIIAWWLLLILLLLALALSIRHIWSFFKKKNKGIENGNSKYARQ